MRMGIRCFQRVDAAVVSPIQNSPMLTATAVRYKTTGGAARHIGTKKEIGAGLEGEKIRPGERSQVCFESRKSARLVVLGVGVGRVIMRTPLMKIPVEDTATHALLHHSCCLAMQAVMRIMALTLTPRHWSVVLLEASAVALVKGVVCVDYSYSGNEELLIFDL